MEALLETSNSVKLQYSTVQYSTVQYNIVHYSTVREGDNAVHSYNFLIATLYIRSPFIRNSVVKI